MNYFFTKNVIKSLIIRNLVYIILEKMFKCLTTYFKVISNIKDVRPKRDNFNRFI